jgi:hypothetical protein
MPDTNNNRLGLKDSDDYRETSRRVRATPARQDGATTHRTELVKSAHEAGGIVIGTAPEPPQKFGIDARSIASAVRTAIG